TAAPPPEASPARPPRPSPAHRAAATPAPPPRHLATRRAPARGNPPLRPGRWPGAGTVSRATGARPPTHGPRSSPAPAGVACTGARPGRQEVVSGNVGKAAEVVAVGERRHAGRPALVAAGPGERRQVDAASGVAEDRLAVAGVDPSNHAFQRRQRPLDLGDEGLAVPSQAAEAA